MAAGIGFAMSVISVVPSFNEAAAEWPRECSQAPMRHSRMARFNEAAAEWPRECWPAYTDVCAETWASMRPRPNGRGNLMRRTVLLLERPASMRPRPNGRGNV